MRTKDIIKNIIKSSKEIEEITADFIEFDVIPQIDIDLSLSKVRTLYDELLKLNRYQETAIISELNFTEASEKPETETKSTKTKKAPVAEIIIERESQADEETFADDESDEPEIEFELIGGDDAPKGAIIIEKNFELEEEEEEEEYMTEDLNEPDIEFELIEGDNAPKGAILIEKNIPESPESLNEPEIEVELLKGDDAPKGAIHIEAKKTKIDLNEIEKEIATEFETKNINKAENHIQTETISDKAEALFTIADQFQDTNNKKSIHDVIAKQYNPRDLASKLQDKPISDIKSCIGLNDRFLFTKELFNGNAKKYNETLEVLNNLKDLDQAMEHLNEAIEWTPEKESFKKFIELVYRRYIPVRN